MPRRICRYLSIAALAAVAVTLATAPVALAQDAAAQVQPPTDPNAPAAPATEPKGDPRIDEATGTQIAEWPPDRTFDFQHMKLEMDIPEMNEKKFTARQTLTISPVAIARNSITLDARDTLTFAAATINGRPAELSHKDAKLTVRFPEPLQPGQPATLIIDYSAVDPSRDSVGLCWFKAREEREQAPQLYSQGEACWNSYWFPCHDFPNLRLSTELIVTTEDGYEVISNGRLVGVGEAGKGRKRWHWLQEKPHPNYLVTLVIGKFDVVTLGGPKSARPGLWMPVYGPPGSKEGLTETFAETPDMVKFFEETFDEPYPWDKYAQVLVRNFRWAGMENTSASTLGEFAARAGKGTQDDLISHELAHQWMGDLVTCKSWEHLWLNEGWATLAEALWAGHKGGREGYYEVIYNNLNNQRTVNVGMYPRNPAMVSNRYTNPDETFTKMDDVYAKGGLILHMLKHRLGDEVFWKGARTYLKRYRFKEAETDDFRRVMEEVSGQSLERFFDQWAKRPGLPRLAVDLAWDAGSGKLSVVIDQTQTINADNPAYALRVPLLIERDGAEPTYVYVDTETKHAAATFSLPGKPKSVTVDPNVANASKVVVRQPLAWGVHQMLNGSNVIVRSRGAGSVPFALLTEGRGYASDFFVRVATVFRPAQVAAR